jgi:spore maturation protein CgeB
LKVLAICQSLDLADKELGITPAWWQILKGLHEVGVEVVAIPYYNRAVQSLWWNTYENPNLWKNKAYNIVENASNSLRLSKNKMEFRQKNQKVINFLVKNFVRNKWPKYLRSVMQKERDIDAILVLTVPLNQFVGCASFLKKEFGVPIIFYDGDTPASLPSYGGLSFSFYFGADPSEYDAFIINSKGAAEEVKSLGAPRVDTVYWGVDPGVFCPIIGAKQEIDVGFFGVGSKLREESITRMLVNPARKRNPHVEHTIKFAVCGRAFDMDLGPVRLFDPDDCSYRRFSCQTKVNLNIARKPLASVYASSNARIFELASMGCCVVSNPYNGIEEWFNVGKEILVAKTDEEVSELYNWLLSDEEARLRLGNAARYRVLQEHTHKHRAQELLKIIKSVH